MKGPRLGIAAPLLLALGFLLPVSAGVAGVFVDRKVARTLTRQATAEVQGRAVAVAHDLVAEQRASTGRSLPEDLADIATGTTYALLTDASGRFEPSKGHGSPERSVARSNSVPSSASSPCWAAAYAALPADPLAWRV